MIRVALAIVVGVFLGYAGNQVLFWHGTQVWCGLGPATDQAVRLMLLAGVLLGALALYVVATLYYCALDFWLDCGEPRA